MHTYARGRDAVHAASRPFVCGSAAVYINPRIADTGWRYLNM